MKRCTVLAFSFAFLLAACGEAPAPTGGIGTAASAVRSPAPTLPADACNVAGVTYCTLNPQVTQATIATTICVVGWTKTVRPPTSYTSPLKVKQIAAEGLTDTDPSHYEEDHRVPLELGGAPSDPLNLSPEAHPGSFSKDGDENAYRASVCSGAQTLREAQAAFVARWLGPYPAYRS